MSIIYITESIVEGVALDWFKELGFTVISGPDIAPGEPAAERTDYGQVILKGRLQSALAKVNPSFIEGIHSFKTQTPAGFWFPYCRCFDW